jgi:hypothetical protein
MAISLHCLDQPARPAPDPWPAPLARGSLNAVVALPGSKSVTNRALVLAALADGRSTVRRPLRSRDSELMAAALRGLGVDVTDTPEGDWQVDGVAGPLQPRTDAIDVGNAGTVARFLPPVATLAVGDVRFDGDPRVRERPLGPLLAALRQLGADLDGVTGLPLVVSGQGSLRGGTVVPGRLAVLAVRQRAAAVRAAVRAGGDRPARRWPAAEHAAPRHDGRGAARLGRGRGRLGGRDLGRVAGALTPGTRSWSRTCPPRRPLWPRRWSPAARSPCRAGRAARRSRARCCPSC